MTSEWHEWDWPPSDYKKSRMRPEIIGARAVRRQLAIGFVSGLLIIAVAVFVLLRFI